MPQAIENRNNSSYIDFVGLENYGLGGSRNQSILGGAAPTLVQEDYLLEEGDPLNPGLDLRLWDQRRIFATRNGRPNFFSRPVDIPGKVYFNPCEIPDRSVAHLDLLEQAINDRFIFNLRIFTNGGVQGRDQLESRVSRKLIDADALSHDSAFPLDLLT